MDQELLSTPLISDSCVAHAGGHLAIFCLVHILIITDEFK
jgi:hypothetical protein